MINKNGCFNLTKWERPQTIAKTKKNASRMKTYFDVNEAISDETNQVKKFILIYGLVDSQFTLCTGI